MTHLQNTSGLQHHFGRWKPRNGRGCAGHVAALRDLETAFLAKLQPAVQKVAKDEGFQIVFNLDEGVISWADPSLDIRRMW
jgi:hypothetical protein